MIAAHRTGRRAAGGAAAGRTTAAVLAVLVPALLAAGCGVPTFTDVRVDGPGPRADRLAAGGDAGPRGPSEASTREQLVEFFLLAAAGDLGTARDRVSEFIHPDDRATWDPGLTVTVVRAAEGEGPPEFDSDGNVEILVRPVGELTAGGYVEPPATDELMSYTFRVVDDLDTDGGAPARDFSRRFYIREPPQVILMKDTALRDYYLPTPVYFWESVDGDSLVPDLRWLPRTLPAEQRPDQLANWLVDGPSPWLESQVAALPDGTDLRDRVVPAQDTVRVNLNAAAADGDLEKLGMQLQWTLRPVTTGGPLELSVEERLEVVGPRNRRANLAATANPASFAILDGVIRQQRGDPVQQIAALPEELNAGVASAAATRDGRAAAVVRLEQDGRHRLTVLVAGQDGALASRVAASMSQPVWLDPTARVGLVVADGRLLRLTPDGITELPVPSLDGTLTTVAVAPDGRRLALVADGRLYVVPVRRDGGAVTASPRALSTTGNPVTHVRFASELRLIYADAGAELVTLRQITVDGAEESFEAELRTSGLTHLVALPVSPWDDSGGLIMYEADGQSYLRRLRDPLSDVGPTAEQISVDSLIDAPEESETAPHAPFFLE